LQEQQAVLFLGADVLATSKQLVNHHVRIHSRYAKLGLATKVTMNGLFATALNQDKTFEVLSQTFPTRIQGV